MKIPRKVGYDKRIKLSDFDIQDIEEKYKHGMSIRAIAKYYSVKCSRRLIQFVLFPERRERANILRREKGNVYYERDRCRGYIKKYRHHKQGLFKNGELIKGEIKKKP